MEAEEKDKNERNLGTGLRYAFQKYGLAPRPHQVRTVAKIIMDVASYQFTKEHEIRNYLIQHTAGSGKSLTIALLVLCLQKLKYGSDRRGFDMVLVLNDRIVLDDQLSKAVTDFLAANNVHDVAQIEKVEELKTRLITGRKGVIITTLQKFTSIKSEIDFKVRRIAIIADEAHRSHGSAATGDLHSKLIGSKDQSDLLTYFSFTCSPTQRTIEQFGTKSEDNKRPFYCYSVSESINHGFTLDVLSGFTYVPEGSLGSDLSEKDDLIRSKANYIVKHFISKSKELSKDNFVAKSMLIVKGRENILKFKNAIEAAIRQTVPQSQQFDVICTFTPFGGTGQTIKETDVAVNQSYCDKNLVEVFKDPHSKVKMIIVAEKLQTGFDAPTLAVMYVDKKMKDASLVQTLGRVSRVAPGKTETCIVDFHNTLDQAKAAFESFEFEPEDESGIDQKIETAHQHNKILESLVLDLHGIVLTESDMDFRRQVYAGKQRTISNEGNQSIYGEGPVGFVNAKSVPTEVSPSIHMTSAPANSASPRRFKPNIPKTTSAHSTSSGAVSPAPVGLNPAPVGPNPADTPLQNGTGVKRKFEGTTDLEESSAKKQKTDDS